MLIEFPPRDGGTNGSIPPTQTIPRPRLPEYTKVWNGTRPPLSEVLNTRLKLTGRVKFRITLPGNLSSSQLLARSSPNAAAVSVGALQAAVATELETREADVPDVDESARLSVEQARRRFTGRVDW